MAILDFLMGSSGKARQLPTMSKGQLGLQDQALRQALSGMQGMQNRPVFNFEPIAQQARTQFQTQTIPQLAERFTSMGGGQRSSAFQGALGQAGAGLEESLAALKEQYGLQERGQEQNWLNSLMSSGMQPRFQYAQMPPSQGLLQSLLPLLITGGVGKALGGSEGALKLLGSLMGGER